MGMGLWSPYKDGNTLGQCGSEGGTIIRDELYSDGARITLEKNTTSAMYAITCGVAGCLVHTVFPNTSREEEAQSIFESMKREIERLVSYANREPFTAEDQRFLVDQIKAFVRHFE